MKKRIAIFASGTGTNTRNILEHLKDHPALEIALVVSNRANAGVLDVARMAHVSSYVLSSADVHDARAITALMHANQIDFIVLSGYMQKIPAALAAEFSGRMINIHPALLPKFGGKGMYGRHVHQAVKDAGESETGITIHYVTEEYDEGKIIFQTTCPVKENDTPESIEQKVHLLEYTHYPRVIAEVVQSLT